MSCCDTESKNACCSTKKIVCSCTYSSCSRKNKCCDCLHYHKSMNELPACYFNAKYEKTYDRSINNFIKMLKEEKAF